MMQRLSRTILYSVSSPKIPTIEEVKQNWNDYSSGYNTFDVGPQTLFSSLINIMKMDEAQKILEVACGTGKMLPYAIERKNAKASYLASDLAPNMIQLAQSNLKKRFQAYQSTLSFEEWTKKQKIDFKVINAEEPFPEKDFDRIICNCALMITQNASKMLRNLHNHSKKGCLFGLSVWGKKQQNNLFTVIRQSILENNVSLPQQRSNFHLYRKVQKLASQAGWQVVLNWEQNTLFPVLQYDPKKDKELFLYQISKLPVESQEKVRSTLQNKLKRIFAEKKGVNFSCEMYVLRKL